MTVVEAEKRIERLKSDFNTLSKSMDRNPNKKAKRILKDRMINISERIRMAGIDRVVALKNERGLSTISK